MTRLSSENAAARLAEIIRGESNGMAHYYVALDGADGAALGALSFIIARLILSLPALVRNLPRRFVSYVSASAGKIISNCAYDTASLFYSAVPFITGTGAVSTVIMAVILVAYAFFKNPTSSLMDSWLVRTIDRRRTFKYGAVRLLGSIGYATMCIVFGIIAKRLGTQRYTFFFYAALNIPLLLFCVLGMKDERADEARVRAEKTQTGKKEKKKHEKGKSPLLLALKAIISECS